MRKKIGILFRRKKTQVLAKISSIFDKKNPRKNEPLIITGMFGLKYLFLPDSALDDHLLKYGILKDWITLHLDEVVLPDSIIFDIGANVGLLTIPFAAKHLPKGRVYAFEPDFENVSQLYINTRINKLNNVIIEQMAIQDKEEISSLEFFIRRAIDGDGLINQGISTLKKMPIHNQKSIIVSATTIDKYVSENKINRLDFIKIDVEGSEFNVLSGGEKTLRKLEPIILYEYSSEIDRLTATENSLQSFQLLNDFGYTQFEIVNEEYLQRLIEPPTEKFGCNILCFPKSKIPSNLPHPAF